MALRFLIVDDTRFMRIMLTDILRKLDHEVVGEAENGQRAIDLYKELRPDITFMDITMPEMDGMEAMEHIRGFDPKAVIIICSAVNQQDLVEGALKRGANGYVVKPFKPKQIKEAIEKYAVERVEERKESLLAAEPSSGLFSRSGSLFGGKGLLDLFQKSSRDEADVAADASSGLSAGVSGEASSAPVLSAGASVGDVRDQAADAEPVKVPADITAEMTATPVEARSAEADLQAAPLRKKVAGFAEAEPEKKIGFQVSSLASKVVELDKARVGSATGKAEAAEAVPLAKPEFAAEEEEQEQQVRQAQVANGLSFSEPSASSVVLGTEDAVSPVSREAGPAIEQEQDEPATDGLNGAAIDWEDFDRVVPGGTSDEEKKKEPAPAGKKRVGFEQIHACRWQEEMDGQEVEFRASITVGDQFVEIESAGGQNGKIKVSVTSLYELLAWVEEVDPFSFGKK